MGPERSAVFSEVELQPDDSAFEVVQGDLVMPTKPMVCPRNKFGRLLADVGVVIEPLSGRRCGKRTSQQRAKYGDEGWSSHVNTS